MKTAIFFPLQNEGVVAKQNAHPEDAPVARWLGAAVAARPARFRLPLGAFIGGPHLHAALFTGTVSVVLFTEQ
jgi:hypothetical protein